MAKTIESRSERVKGCITFNFVYTVPATAGEGGQPDSGRLEHTGAQRALTMEFNTDTTLTAGTPAVGCDALYAVLGECAPEPLTRVRTSARWITENGTDRAAAAGLGFLRVIARESTIGLLRCAHQLAVNALTRIRDAVPPAVPQFA